MRKMFLTAVFLMAQPVVGAEQVSPSIVNGSNAYISNYPYMASLYYDRRDDYGYYSNYCGATILDSKHVMTAAHCVQDNFYNKYTTVVLQLERDGDFSSAQKIKAKSFYYRDDYKDGSYYLWENDIAIIELESEMVGVPSNQFVPLPSASDIANYRVSGAKFKAIGHGNTKSNYDTSDHLLQVDLDYVTHNSCTSFASVKGGHICTRGSYSVTTGLYGAICQGDSGGPLVWFDGGKFIQIGIASFGPSICGNPSSSVHGVFTEVADYLPWISSVLAGNETPKYNTSDPASQNVTPKSEPEPTNNGDTEAGSLAWWIVPLLALFRFRRREV
ncbi:putative trypsin-like serine protease [Vibrio nigripulchritudo SOn1]|uniref:Trypsin-like serine protease n=1 Tax=Vibrio nigripulchritudo SOn1 TaxID=1238450 RepID=A0AAV2VY96_9VIBR|nr:serine protease [Vibrio nigripulchritudo]CCO49742.1 putative trypsin-like serine protease [Vibrio nigripulchritudo SOn1]